MRPSQPSPFWRIYACSRLPLDHLSRMSRVHQPTREVDDKKGVRVLRATYCKDGFINCSGYAFDIHGYGYDSLLPDFAAYPRSLTGSHSCSTDRRTVIRAPSAVTHDPLVEPTVPVVFLCFVDRAYPPFTFLRQFKSALLRTTHHAKYPPAEVNVALVVSLDASTLPNRSPMSVLMLRHRLGSYHVGGTEKMRS